MKIVIATRSREKFEQIKAIYRQVPVTLIPLYTCDVPILENPGLSFVEKALAKARHAAKHTGFPSIADDTGLVIDAFGGAPGIHSSHYEHEGASTLENQQKVLKALAPLPEEDCAARFYSAIVFVLHAQDPIPIICQAEWEGRILKQPSGSGDLGYDSIFYLPDQGCTIAELSEENRNALSPRARALRKLATYLPHIDAPAPR
jgi:XTP/dITP diphosphohydrolase